MKIEKTDKNKYQISWDKTDIKVILNVVKENNNWKINSFDIINWENIKKEVTDYWTSKGKENPKRFSK